MLVSEVMTPEPVKISKDCTLFEAAQLMRDENCGVLPIMDEEKVVGIVTDRDIVIYADAEDHPLKETSVTKIMADNVVVCKENESLEDVADRMSVSAVRRLVVLDMEENISGIVSLHDLMLNIGDQGTTDEVMHHLLRYA